ncbi:MAG: DUF6798 domain-containing protein [Bacteroidota bacterium]
MKPISAIRIEFPPKWVWAFSLITTLFYYRYGIYDQIEQLPIIMRAMDSSYLQNDFFVEASAGFGPRYYYSQLIANIASFIGLPLSMFLLTLLSQAGIAWVSWAAGKSLFPEQEYSGLWAAALCMSVQTVQIGSDNTVYELYLIPGMLIAPLVLGSIWKAWEGNLVLAAIGAGLASLVHVLYGLEVGLLVLGSAFLMNPSSLALWKKLIPSGLILLAFGSLTLIPYLSLPKSLENGEFVDIIAHFRHPHHYIPSYILSDWGNILFGVCWLGIGLLAFRSRKRITQGKDSRGVFIRNFFWLILLAAFTGWLMVEIFPSRLFTTAQTWRLLNLLKWMAVILLAGQISIFINSWDTSAYVSTYLSFLTPFTAFAQSFRIQSSRFPSFWLGILGIGGAGVLLLFGKITLTGIGLSLLYTLWLSLIMRKDWRFWANGLFLACLLFTAAQLTLLPGQLPNSLEKYASKAFRPSIFQPPYEEEVIEFSNWLREHSPKDAVVLAPPRFGGVRILGQRALVADFKAFPFGDEAIKSWYQRCLMVYGKNYEEKDRLSFYQKLGPEQLSAIHQKYPFDYAIIGKNKLLSWEVLLVGKEYDLVKWPE